MSAQTDTLLVELDVREIRAAHSAMSLLRNVLEPECAGIHCRTAGECRLWTQL